MWGAILGPFLAVALVVSAWAIDAGLAGDQVLRNVALAGDDIGGLDENKLAERVDRLSESMDDRAVEIVTPEVTYETTASGIGLLVDEPATIEEALDAGRGGALPARPVRWVSRFFSEQEVPVQYSVNVETARAELLRLEGDALVSPLEPTIESIDGGPFTMVPGESGTGIDPEVLATALVAAAEGIDPAETVVVQVRQGPLDPRLDNAVAVAAASDATALTDDPLTIALGDREIVAESGDLRSWVEPVQTEDDLLIGFSPDAIESFLESSGIASAAEPVDARFDIVDGAVVLEPSSPGATCCSDDAAEDIEAAIREGLDRVEVEPVLVPASFTTADAEALGITEEIGAPDAFGPTTRHNCCEGRVTNIHRIADIVRGAIIRPGETFSLNEYVGERTIERGFVAAGVIYDGEFSTDVGGGISQFATSLFNAALFGGLDFGRYQSHSIYISRYPRGHEATISWGGPELEIENTTPYGVMIWPTYTATSITVHLYSTKYASVSVGDPTSTPQGNCTRWTTPRTRVYPDGTEDRDSVSALYRPEEGVTC